MAKRRKKTLQEKYVELLESQVDLLEKMNSDQERRIQELEGTGTVTTNIPPYITTPFTFPAPCQHQYPQVWQGTTPPSCVKCGQSQWGHSSGIVTIAGLPPGAINTNNDSVQAQNSSDLPL